MLQLWVALVMLGILVVRSSAQLPYEFPDHPIKSEFHSYLSLCKTNKTYCDIHTEHITLLAARISNDYSGLLHPDTAQTMLQEAFYYIEPASQLGTRLNHMMAILAFSQGDRVGAQKYWDSFNKSDLVSIRSLSAQMLMTGNEERRGIEQMKLYTAFLADRFESILQGSLRSTLGPDDNARNPKHKREIWAVLREKTIDILCKIGEFILRLFRFGSKNVSVESATRFVLDRKTPVRSSNRSELLLLDLLLSEAQGGIRKNIRLADMGLSPTDFEEMNSGQRFRLAVGLAKLGLFDLSLRHVWLSATPWEAPLYLFRAKLVFPPVHKDVRSLALAVDHFERQGEQILLQRNNPQFNAEMARVCDSPNEAALALQSLPLLHLAGCSSPRHALSLGHSPVSLSTLLSEIFTKMCPPHRTPAHLHPWGEDATPASALASLNGKQIHNTGISNEVIRIGIVSGSADGVPGKIVVGLLSSLRRELLGDIRVELIAMCFPTPRDQTTDRANAVFDKHINLTPYNKTEAIHRILDTHADIILFADAALDSRVFALAHERLAVWQGSLWGWGGSLGIHTMDFYFVPEPLMSAATCPRQTLRSNPLGQDGENIDSDLEYYENIMEPPQTLYSEQVVLLKGLPPLPAVRATSRTELWKILQERYLLPPANQVHLYLFPGSVRHMHPEFDAVLDVLLRTDPAALVVLAVPRSGRDNLPTVHVAVRHDLMHPTMPVAAVSKLRQRLRSTIGVEAANRVRVLPPLDEQVYHALRRQVIAVLDPFPVGLHVQILEALKEGIPVVSAPALQECTHSYMPGIARALRLSFWDWPYTAEEYAVLAMRLQRERSLQMSFVPPDALRTSFIPTQERISTLTPDVPTQVSHTDRVRGTTHTSYEARTGGSFDAEVSTEALHESNEHDAANDQQLASKKMNEAIDRLEDGTHGEQLVAFLLRLKNNQRKPN